MNRYVCIHGHFYQPPRENPWLEYVEVQDSAYPYHDWNERITAECYAPNGRSRILNREGKIAELVNNYSYISFNVGPTLLAWLAEQAPAVYQTILQGDRESQKRFSGHGSALAQAYNHMILPLANQRDITTQVNWGIADFKSRFDREPEGMWLPVPAVDTRALETLAKHGITALAVLASKSGRKSNSVPSAHETGRTPRAGVSIPPCHIWSGCRRAHALRSSSTMGRSRGRWRSRICSTAATLSRIACRVRFETIATMRSL